MCCTGALGVTGVGVTGVGVTGVGETRRLPPGHVG